MATQAVFRRGNDAIAHAARRVGVHGRKIEFICECLDLDCLGRVPLTLEDYERIRESGRAITLPDHAASE